MANPKVFGRWMQRQFIIILIAAFLTLSFQCGVSYAKERAGAVLFPAYSFFVNLKNHNYKKTWSLLTHSSRKTIVKEIEGSFVKKKINIGVRRISKSMKTGGYIAKSYWGGFLKSFNPDMVLKYSAWKVKSIGSKKARIEIDYKYAKAPTFLKMYKQNGKWRLGLMESLYGRILMGKIAHKVLNKF